MAVEVEDDVFFADLSKQIALLIMDDEEEFPVQCPQLPVQDLPYMPQVMMPPPYGYELLAYRRESKGTGVFIPRSAAPRRKNNNRSRRSTAADSNTTQRQLNKSAAVASKCSSSSSVPKRQTQEYQMISGSY
ncbi:hypothetical protein OPV22_011033 [Ensete ventricosum]|uniref:Uncharacterized protein n=1 Tax=Ensete ventricosum TaxID=4639 RepID=A0AAV8RIP3_ENSVE|nr:hypothetical protein OPV22_011033 [Ensete ventricosum]RWW59889.1 hypothetical protein BHE74_00033154 [Ensete ventricosum]